MRRIGFRAGLLVLRAGQYSAMQLAHAAERLPEGLTAPAHPCGQCPETAQGDCQPRALLLEGALAMAAVCEHRLERGQTGRHRCLGPAAVGKMQDFHGVLPRTDSSRVYGE